MSRTIFRGTALGGASDREAHLYAVNDRIVIAITDGKGRVIDAVSLDLDMADALGTSIRHRALDVRMELEEATP